MAVGGRSPRGRGGRGAVRGAGTDGEIPVMKGLKTAGPRFGAGKKEKGSRWSDGAGGGGGGGGRWVEVETAAGGWSTASVCRGGGRARSGSGVRGVREPGPSGSGWEVEMEMGGIRKRGGKTVRERMEQESCDQAGTERTR